MPLCWTHSPTPNTAGSFVRSWSSTTIARSQARPHSFARSTFGRMPAEMTTMSAGISVPSANFTPVDVRVAEDFLRARAGQRRDAHLLDRLAEHLPAGLVELHAHQPRGHLDHRDRDVVRHQPLRGFEAEQPAADDDRGLAVLRVLGDVAAVVERAEHEHAVQRRAGDRRDERLAAGGEDEVVVGHRRRRPRERSSRRGRSRVTRLPGVERDAVLFVPRERVEEDFLRVLRAVEHVRQQDAVVVAVRLVAEDGDVEAVRVDTRARLRGAAPRPCRCRSRRASASRGCSARIMRGLLRTRGRRSSISFSRYRTTSPTTNTAGPAIAALPPFAPMSLSSPTRTRWPGSVPDSITAAGVSGDSPLSLSVAAIFATCRTPM